MTQRAAVTNRSAVDSWRATADITSDCGAEDDVVKNHHFADPLTGVKDILSAGRTSRHTKPGPVPSAARRPRPAPSARSPPARRLPTLISRGTCADG